MLPTTVILSSVSGQPQAKLDLPGPLRIGDRIRLRFRLSRNNGGRYEVLDVQGEYKVAAVGFDATGLPRQIIQVDATGKDPAWRAVKKVPVAARRLSPACFPRTVVA